LLAPRRREYVCGRPPRAEHRHRHRDHQHSRKPQPARPPHHQHDPRPRPSLATPSSGTALRMTQKCQRRPATGPATIQPIGRLNTRCPTIPSHMRYARRNEPSDPSRRNHIRRECRRLRLAVADAV
jgi:hypothetical protein